MLSLAQWISWIERRARFWIAFPILLMALLQFGSMWDDSSNSDERGHLAGGYRYWKTGRFHIVEHPPLQGVLTGAALLPLNPPLPAAKEAYADEFAFGSALLFHSPIPTQTLLRYGRVASILLTALLVIVVAWAATQFFGPLAGILAAWLCALDPNIMAHGKTVTTDMGGTLTFTLAIVCWVRYLQSPTGSRAMQASLALGLALSAKMAMLFLLAVFPALLVLHWVFVREPWALAERRVATLFLTVLGAFLVLILLYLPNTWNMWLDQKSGAAGHPIPWIVLPIYTYVEGILFLRSHSSTGHPAYLLGEISRMGWWYYFPFVLLVKSPVAFLLLAIAAIGTGVRRIPSLFRTPASSALCLCLLVPPLIYFGFAMNSHINIGVRHILPVFPLLYILGAAAVVHLLPRRMVPAAVIGLALLQTVESVAAYPYYTAFFNFPSGGRAAGPRYLLDSNLDWGQDLYRLRLYADAHPGTPLCVEYFGPVAPEVYGIRGQGIPKTGEIEKRSQMNCVAAISAMTWAGIFQSPDDYRWLREREPMGMVGSSIFLYDLRQTVVNQKK